MAVEERRRLHLYESARERLGPDAADTLMELLPTMDWSELATKDDLTLTRSELRTEMAGLRTEMADLRTEMRTEMGELRTEMRTEMADLRTEMHDLFREQTNRILMFTLPAILTGIGLSFGAAQFAG